LWCVETDPAKLDTLERLSCKLGGFDYIARRVSFDAATQNAATPESVSEDIEPTVNKADRSCRRAGL
jgi:hypothetical protein